MDRSDKNHKSSKRSRDNRYREDHKHRPRDRDSDSHHHHRHHHQRSEKDSHGDRAHNRSFSRQEDREGSRDRELPSEPQKKSRERLYEEREEGKKKRKGREDEEARGDNDCVGIDSERERKRERRRFGEKVKKEEGDEGVGDVAGPVIEARVKVKEEEVKDFAIGNGAFNGHGATVESFTKPSKDFPDAYLPPPQPDPSKVSSISNTNENRGVSVTRSHEVPGNSSTDGTSASAAGKSGSQYLDALVKAKKALQMQKELSEKLKRLPQLTNRTAAAGVGSKAQTSTGLAAAAQATSATVSAAAMPSPSVSSAAVASIPAIPGLTGLPNYEAVKRAQELAAKMGFRQDPQFAPLINLFPGQMPPEISVPQKPNKAPVLRVDALGREIDEHGNVVNATKPSNLSTLKVNINKQKKEAFQILKPEIDMDPETNPHFDPKMGVNMTKLLRPKRGSFQFVEEGKWAKEAEIMKIKNKFGDEQAKDMKARQALHAKAKAAPDINPNLIEVSERVMTKEKTKDPIPEIEWWDVPLLLSGKYIEIGCYVSEDQLRREKITIYVEHPRPIEPPAEPAPPPPQPLKLTKKEQKKLRTQRRLAREKDRQEMIRQGLIEPPKPKVKMSNLMKVLGSEATQDPTRLEMEIRSAAAEREQAHIDRNFARKLTPAERRQKKEKKLFDDANTLETIVSVYKINKLSDKKTRFKVDVNAHENRLTGCCVISDGATVVVVEGGSKSIKRYGKLMLSRINWAEAINEEDGDDNKEKPENKCLLVWQGSVAKACFHKFSFHECMTEAAAKKIFTDAGVGHYWVQAVNFSEDDMSNTLRMTNE